MQNLRTVQVVENIISRVENLSMICNFLPLNIQKLVFHLLDTNFQKLGHNKILTISNFKFSKSEFQRYNVNLFFYFYKMYFYVNVFYFKNKKGSISKGILGMEL